jgi:hypothetical protein
MAKINARGARQIGPTLYTEKTLKFDFEPTESVYYEAWRLRSDGSVLTRIIRTTSLEGHVTKHSSGFRIMGTFKARPLEIDLLRNYLERKGYRIVKTSY